MLWERLLAVAFAGNQCNKIHCDGSQKNLCRKGVESDPLRNRLRGVKRAPLLKSQLVRKGPGRSLD